MFSDEEDVVAYEDELYREASSSDESVDSEVEFHLYSQVHYSQSLSGTQEELDGPDTEYAATEEIQTVKANVITISDSDDIRASDSSAVIILSDSIDETSVNYLKGRGKPRDRMNQPTNQSTPKSLNSKKKREQKTKPLSSSKSYKDGVVQEVLVIRGSSEDESVNKDNFLTSDSDQSDVENWMLLGRAKEDGDASIQLNFHGSRNVLSEGDSEMDWSISKKDSEANIANYSGRSRRSNRYYTDDKNVICRNCNFRGHLSKNCPVPKKLPACCLCGRRGHLQYTCPSQYCSNCFLPGHFYQDCTERPLWQKKCHRCAMIGHYADACPDIWRQYHLTVKPGLIKKSKLHLNPKSTVYCCNCGKKGHCSYECKDRRMHSSVHPSCELISAYDKDHDIRKRSNRAKRKFEELQEAGLLSLEILELQDNVDESSSFSNPSRKKRRKESKRAKDDVNRHPKAKKKTRSKKPKGNLLKHEEGDFPRGTPDENPKKGGQRHKKKKSEDLLFKNPKDEKDLHGHSKKHRKRSRGKKGNRVPADLLTIKQKKKKIKKEN